MCVDFTKVIIIIIIFYYTGLFASAGSDKLILVYEPYNPSSPLYTLVGHTENVCALSIAPNGDLISGSWDK